VIFYDIEDHDAAIFETFSDNLKASIMASPEWAARDTGGTPDDASSAPSTETAPYAGASCTDDDIPFALQHEF